MSLFVASINSGSNGNCYYVGNATEAVLIDAGISCRETGKRMKRIGLNIKKVKAIFISHEHGDHIRGLEVLSRRFRIPVYITPGTLQNSNLKLEKDLVFSFRAYEPVSIGNLLVHPFLKKHDAADPHSFVVEGNGLKIGVFTDIGEPCEHLAIHFSQCHAAFLEANYDEQMLQTGRYPVYLKRRISGEFGHLSNKQALDLFLSHKSPNLSHLFLSHLSKENNTPEIAMNLFTQNAGNTKIIHASRYNETTVYHVFDKSTEASVDSNFTPGEMKQSHLF